MQSAPPKLLSVPPPRARSRWATWADSVGSAGAVVCAVHCAVLPFAIALLPALGLGWLASSGIELGYVAFATALAVASLWQGYRRHRVYRALAFLVPGLAAVWAGILVPALHEDVVRHAVVMTFGGTLIAVAHLINLRLTHGHVHDAGCAHHH
ncbi:MerC domain-containing protein [Arenimonas oryziterrae]|uniref:MerC mercury resistance protein n=1 Tax=Arenimonas oryziterrae DSM 21050 = YC6267 TaxID=1121015 RepID=A0A091BKR0_9GAMM|nr:MerC domain-containing protein [Arenimonas oryziterrae]KFN44890.1 hypothetical protein N789_02405 [Arenimonas oryziterrae DSM 21050 = YC6267]